MTSDAAPSTLRRIGRQAGGRVRFILRVEDFHASFDRMRSAGVTFLTPVRREPYAAVAVFLDVAGNRWDLLRPPQVDAVTC